MKMPASGSCQCGSVTYEVMEQPVATAVCHCIDCQKLSAGAFSLTMYLKRSGFRLLSGDLKSWERPTESGGVAVCWFCPDCGNRIYHENPAMPEFIRLKPGTLDDTSVLNPQVLVWTCRRQPWLEHYAELPAFDKQPDLAAAMAAVAEGRSPF